MAEVHNNVNINSGAKNFSGILPNQLWALEKKVAIKTM